MIDPVGVGSCLDTEGFNQGLYISVSAPFQRSMAAADEDPMGSGTVSSVCRLPGSHELSFSAIFRAIVHPPELARLKHAIEIGPKRS